MLADALPSEYPTHTSPTATPSTPRRWPPEPPPSPEPTDQFYGDRLARLTDPHGNQLSISTHIEDLIPDQIAERIASMGEG